MTVLTVGTFDLLHYGHIRLFQRCRELAGENGKVVVGVNSDDFIARYKHAAPIMSYKEREFALLQLPFIDEVVENKAGEDSKMIIEQVQPNLIVIGSDWARKDYYKQMSFTQDWLDERDISLCYVPYTKDISTTEIKQRLSSRLK